MHPIYIRLTSFIGSPSSFLAGSGTKKTRRGRQKKTWGRVIDDLFVSLGLDKAEWLEDIERGESSFASNLACIDECISNRECRKFEEGLVKLAMYKNFGKRIEFKKYLHGVSDAGTRLLLPSALARGNINRDLFSGYMYIRTYVRSVICAGAYE